MELIHRYRFGSAGVPMAEPAVPALFRILLPAKEFRRTWKFYENLLGVPGREVFPGRVYFDVGPVILGLLDYSLPDAGTPAPPTEAVYFAASDLAGVHRKATALGALATELLHGDPDQPMGGIVVRPWGERSFYVTDPSGNALCFVERGTEFTGTAEQVARLRDDAARR